MASVMQRLKQINSAAFLPCIKSTAGVQNLCVEHARAPVHSPLSVQPASSVVGRVGLECLRFATADATTEQAVSVVGSLLDEAHQALMLKDIRPGTLRSYRQCLRYFSHLSTDDLSVSALNEVLMGIPNQNTRRKVVIALKSCVDHPAVKTLRVPAQQAKVYDLPDETTLRLALMTCPHQTRALLMMYAGLRLGEACAVTAASLEGRWLKVDSQVEESTRRIVPVKTNAARIPLPEWLLPQVQGLTEVGSPKAVRKALASAGRRVGIRLNPHQLRHWYATTLVRQGVNPSVVQRLMRHADIRVTFRVYSQVAQGDLTSAIDGLGSL